MEILNSDMELGNMIRKVKELVEEKLTSTNKSSTKLLCISCLNLEKCSSYINNGVRAIRCDNYRLTTKAMGG